MYIYMHTHMHACTYTHIYMYMHMHIHSYKYLHIHTYIYIYISMYNSNDMLNFEYIVNRHILGILVYYVKIIMVSMFMICLADEI